MTQKQHKESREKVCAWWWVCGTYPDVFDGACADGLGAPYQPVKHYQCQVPHLAY